MTRRSETTEAYPLLVLGLLIAALILAMLDRLALGAVLEEVKHHFSLTDRQLGLLQGGAFGLFYTVMGLPLGLLADRWSNRGTIILGYVVWSFATLATGLATGFSALIGARILVGCGEAALSPAGYSLLRQYFPRQRLALAISIFQMGSVLGSAIAFGLVGLLDGWLAHGGAGLVPAGYVRWQVIFMLLGAIGFVFLPSLFLLRDRPPLAEAAPQPEMSLGGYLAGHVAIWLPLFFGMAGIIILAYALMGWMPAVFAREFGWTPGRFGPLYGLIVLGTGTIGMLSGGWLTDRINMRTDGKAHLTLPLAVAVLLVPLLLALSVAGSPATILALLVPIQILTFMPLGVAPAFVQLWTPVAIRGRLSAVYILIVNGMSLGLAPLLIGAISGETALGAHSLRAAVCLVSGVFLGVAVLLLAWLAHHHRRSGRLSFK